MTATSREIAEKLYDDFVDMQCVTRERCVKYLTAALEEREREGYLRGIEDADKEVLSQGSVYFDNMEGAGEPEFGNYSFAVATCRYISNRLRALAHKAVKP